MVSKKQIESAAEIIKSGGLVAFPTETVYGLGADALNPNAVAKIFIEKERPSFDPLIIHISNIKDVERLTKEHDHRVDLLAKMFWPGPLTIVLPKSDIVPDIVTSGLPTVGIRMPNNKIALDLITTAGSPIAAPSANKFGRISPTTASHVKKQLTGVECVLDGGPCQVGIESTVISLNRDGFVILREGAITSDNLQKAIPQSKEEKTKSPVASPGLLQSHYSPEKPLFILETKEMSTAELLEYHLSNKKLPKGNGAFISFSGKKIPSFSHTEYLSKNRDLKEAAINLFSILHKLEDNLNIDYIVAESVPLEGIGRAIMDKLNKAAHRYNNK